MHLDAGLVVESQTPDEIESSKLFLFGFARETEDKIELRREAVFTGEGRRPLDILCSVSSSESFQEPVGTGLGADGQFVVGAVCREESKEFRLNRVGADFRREDAVLQVFDALLFGHTENTFQFFRIQATRLFRAVLESAGADESGPEKIAAPYEFV